MLVARLRGGNMDYAKLFLIALCAILAALLLSTFTQVPAPNALPTPTPTPPELPQLGIFNAPVVANLNSQPTLMYEIYATDYSALGYATDYSALGLQLAKVEVLDHSGMLLESVEGTALNLRPLNYTKMGWYHQGILLWVEPDAGKPLPTSISHKAYFTAADGSEVIVQGAETPILAPAPLVISPPVRGEGWLAVEGPKNTNHHRSALIGFQGKIFVPERYAVDWMQIGESGKLWRTDGSTNEDFYCYDQTLYAVADGVVVDVRDGIPDNVPVGSKPATIAVQNIAGNMVVLDIGNSHYAVYAHIIPGTVAVKRGDMVKSGDVIGRLGNSGNSDAPHLHFHICGGMDALFSEGEPYIFANYTKTGWVDPETFFVSGNPWSPTGQPEAHQNEMFACGDIMDFE